MVSAAPKIPKPLKTPVETRRILDALSKQHPNADTELDFRNPYELLVAPLDPEAAAFESPLLAPALKLAAEGVRRLHALEPDAPLNAWVHDVPWWHIEIFPRLSVLAGIELGAGAYINTLPPEEAARRLREAG